jgi:septum formation topological specificity factor MinE
MSPSVTIQEREDARQSQDGIEEMKKEVLNIYATIIAAEVEREQFREQEASARMAFIVKKSEILELGIVLRQFLTGLI